MDCLGVGSIGCKHCESERERLEADRYATALERVAALHAARQRVIDAARTHAKGKCAGRAALQAALQALDKLEAGE